MKTTKFALFISAFYIALVVWWFVIQYSGFKDSPFNLAYAFAYGLIPIFGDVWDFVFKANDKNLKILKQHHEENIIEVEVVE